MSFLNSVKNNIAYSSAGDIAEICAPLFQHFAINYFCYARLYQDNSMMILLSNRDWMYHYIKKQYQLLINATGGIVRWKTCMSLAALTDGATDFNLHNGVSLGKVHKDFFEIIEVASPSQFENPLDFFCSDKNLLNQFIFYFKDRANSLIKKADRDHLHFPKKIFASKNHILLAYNKFHELMKNKHINLNFLDKWILFSRREFEVLFLLAEGRCMVDIAQQLQISPNTIAMHIKNAKNKTSYLTETQLIESFKECVF